MFAFITALATLVIAIVALFQVRTATRAAKAAEGAADEAKEMRFADNRPSLMIARCERHVPIPSFPGQTKLQTWLGLRIVNCGKGAASLKTIGFSLGETEYGREEAEHLPPDHQYYLPPSPEMPLQIPDHLFQAFARKCVGEDSGPYAFQRLFDIRAEQRDKGPRRLQIGGWVEYSDIFERWHGQTFTFRQIGSDAATFEVVPGVYYQPDYHAVEAEPAPGEQTQGDEEQVEAD